MQQENPTVQSPIPTPNKKSDVFALVTELVSKITRALDSLKGKLFTRPTESTVEGGISEVGISAKTKKIVTVTAATFFTLIVILITVSYFKGRISKPAEETKKEDGVQTTIIERKPSRYASDEVVLNMETDTKTLEEEINKAEIEEKSLIPPNLNFNINFNQ